MAEKKQVKSEPKPKSFHLEPGQKVKEAKGDSPHYDKTEAAPGIFVGRGPKFSK